ncbi:hypothetical protein AAF712_007543 [Marasmius tenuissimus]|uniref:Ubiquitin-like domain-containing protein n=1 Tax=Marasmius tenuissimus TaxID=585030 RepID=A0ABR2ZWD5_9AGAR
MPKATKAKATKKNHELLKLSPSDSPEHIKLAIRPARYLDAINLVRKQFKICFEYDITLQTDELDVCEGEMVEITADVWDAVKDDVNKLFFKKSLASEFISHSPSAVARPIQSRTQHVVLDGYPLKDEEERIMIKVDSPQGRREFKVKLNQNIRRLKPAILERIFGPLHTIDPSDYNLVYNGWRLDDRETIMSLGVEAGDCFDLYQVQRGGKPVIYLFSPQTIEAKISLSLVPQWEFSVLYPVVPVKRIVGSQVHQEIEWTVETRPDGSMVEKVTGLEVSYLFWEAHTCSSEPSPPPSPCAPAGQTLDIESFVPTSAQLDPHNSVLLSIEDLPAYLDRALAALSLHTEARTSFITYWLPSFLKHTHVALRFLPQSAYESAAPLDISPPPDVVTRVFMLFRGVSSDEMEHIEGDDSSWQEAVRRTCEDVDFWRKIVGVDLVKCMDSALFRVLEWGGMEVL